MIDQSEHRRGLPRRLVWTVLLLVIAYLLSGHGREAASLYGRTSDDQAGRSSSGDGSLLAFRFAGDNSFVAVTPTVTIGSASPPVNERVDLTGDGVAESITVRGNRLQIHQDDRRVWESNPDWWVVDVALGDPNNDGRFEAMVAFETPDSAGRPQSQPFIVGYRRGLFGTWWGGSPIDNPLVEIELADVDDDGRQELLAIERLAGSGRRVTVWRWHGWGFSLIWSSKAGAYQNLSVRDITGDGPPEILVSVPS